VRRLGREVGGVGPDRAQSSQRRGDRRAVEQTGLVQRRAVEQLRRRRGCGAGRAAAARIDPDVGDAAAVEPQRERDQIATGGAAGRAPGSAGNGLAAPRVVVEIGREGNRIHGLKGRAGRAPGRRATPSIRS
jgi:hypothetical protein